MLRKIRITLAAVFFIGLTLLFLDFTGTLHAWLGWMAKVQFWPAVLALNVADEVYVDDVYAAREQSIYGADAATLASRIGEKGFYLGDREKIVEAVRARMRPGDVLVIMGAGSIEQIFDILPLTDRPEEKEECHD